MRKTLRNIILGTLISLNSLTSFAAYPSPEFITKTGYAENYIDEAKKELKKRDEKFKYLIPLDERQDHDGDGIKDISFKTNKDNIYFMSSIDQKEGRSNSETQLWYLAD